MKSVLAVSPVFTGLYTEFSHWRAGRKEQITPWMAKFAGHYQPYGCLKEMVSLICDGRQDGLGVRCHAAQRNVERLESAVFLANSDAFAALLGVRRQLKDSGVAGVDDNLSDGL